MSTGTTTLELLDFTGGLNTSDPDFLVPLNKAVALQNINIVGKGFEKRRGNHTFNATEMVSTSTPVTGLGYIKISAGTEFLTAIAGTKFFKSDSLDGTMDDVTGAITITTGANNLWSYVNYNDLQIWFGGAPDAPFKYSGTGNIAALGGTPPTAKNIFSSSNRLFAICTAANPSRIAWSVLANPEDWTGAGSGSQDVQKLDGEELLFGVPIGADAAILFKNSSTHLMPLTKAPFPVYTLQGRVGAAGRFSYVFVDGVIYFITPTGRMKATSNGVDFVDFPDDVDSLWDTVKVSRIPYTRGIYYEKLRQIHWLVSTGTSDTHNASIIWDIKNKAWLYHPQGFKANIACIIQNKRLFTGHYNGKIFEQDYSTSDADVSEETTAIDSYWQTPSFKETSMGGIIHPYWIDIIANKETATSITIGYGFNFGQNEKTSSVSLMGTGMLWDVGLWDVGIWGSVGSLRKRVHTAGRGENMNIRIRNSTVDQHFTIHGLSIRIGSNQSSGKIKTVTAKE